MGADILQRWVGRTQVERDTPTALRIAELAATLDDTREYPVGSDVPPGWHWILFHSIGPTSVLGPDGHLPRGGFLPPVTLPRRMWAGGRLKFHKPLTVDEPVERKSEIASISEKSGRNGQLVFVTVRHQLHGAAGLAIEEEQDIVYREASVGAAASEPAPRAEPAWCREIRTERDAALPLLRADLQRASHPLRPRLREEGGRLRRPGGPWTSDRDVPAGTVRAKSNARLASFSYRGVSPLFDTVPFRVCGQPSADAHTAELWAETPQGALAMTAKADFT